MVTITPKEVAGGARATALSSAIDSTQLSLIANSASTYPDGASGKPFVITVDRGTASEEKMLVASRSASSFTITTRGYDGTTAVAHLAGATIHHGLDGLTIRDHWEHITDTARDDHTQYVRQTESGQVVLSGGIDVTGGSAHIGVGAAGASGTYIEIGDLGDPGNIYLDAAGTPANVGIYMRAKGTADIVFRSPNASWFFSRTAGNVVQIENGGRIRSLATDSFFGEGAFGGSGSYLRIGGMGDVNNSYAVAAGSATNVGLVLRPQASGAVDIQTGAGVSNLKVLNDSGETQLRGGIRASGSYSSFGVGVSLTGPSVEAGSFGDSVNAAVKAAGSLTNVPLHLWSKGTPATPFAFLAGAGSTLLSILSTGQVDFVGPASWPSGNTATTVGATGGASALPANPVGYLKVQIAGTERKIPYYNT